MDSLLSAYRILIKLIRKSSYFHIPISNIRREIQVCFT